MSNGKSTIVIPQARMMDHPFEFLDGAASVVAASVLIELVLLIIGLALLIIALAVLIIELALVIKQQAKQIVRPSDVLVRRLFGDDLFCELRRGFRILVRVGDSLEIRVRGGEYAESRAIEQGAKGFFKVFSVDPARTLALVDDHRILAQAQP